MYDTYNFIRLSGYHIIHTKLSILYHSYLNSALRTKVQTTISTPASTQPPTLYIKVSAQLTPLLASCHFITDLIGFLGPTCHLSILQKSWNVRWTRTLPAFQRKDLEEFTMTSNSPSHEIFHATPVLSRYHPTYPDT